MKFLFISFVLLICSFKSDTGFSSYCNSRFDFCIEYPASFSKQQEPDNQDGLTFLSADRKTEIRTFGSLAIEDFDLLSDEFKSATADLKVTYKAIKKDWFIVSGIDSQGRIVYRKTAKKQVNYMGQGAATVFQTLMISYPTSQIDVYNAYCLKIAKSL
jgi:hypothetical protein